jgi:hypothetical protein
MGKKKPSLKKVIDKMADGYCLPPPMLHGSAEAPNNHMSHAADWVCPKAPCLKNDEQRIYYALADLREEIDDMKRCIRALLAHNGIDYLEVIKTKRI